ncbi:SgcJ/EcaC family oxidoreductase [Pendulispora brunnea]|uniref:SgcJ/EcaC family oxidoreductase n=1 Tax=Pendulispora brunnea TaxID=2905690 RepID=A0ABZ2K814_9BACT
MVTKVFLSGLAVLALACTPSGKAMSNDKADEMRIRQIVDEWVGAFRDGNVDRVLTLHAPGIVSFDIVPPLRYVGREAYRKPWDAVFSTFERPIAMEIQDLTITVRDGIAFSHSLNRMVGTAKSGQKSDYWFRWTACYEKIDGQWLIVHDHSSAPTDFASGKASLELKP